MSKILSIDKAIKVSRKLRNERKTIVLAGGCFDILHVGHIKFLKNAKQYGTLIILLESDDSVKKLKGETRPINPQEERAQILSSIQYVDYVVLLNGINSDKNYDKLIANLKPDIIAVTKGSEQLIHIKRQAKNINAKIYEVIAQIKDKSSTKLAILIGSKF